MYIFQTSIMLYLHIMTHCYINCNNDITFGVILYKTTQIHTLLLAIFVSTLLGGCSYFGTSYTDSTDLEQVEVQEVSKSYSDSDLPGGVACRSSAGFKAT